MTDFLAADWGTSNLRAWRLGADGSVKAVRRLPWGVAGLEPGEAARKLAEELRPALGAEHLPAILCGMVGSAMGIAEAPYADCPAGAEDIAQRLLQVDDDTFIVPGLRCARPDGYPDVIRGEETKVLGWLSLDPRRRQGDHVLCLPGTHGKWVRVKDGRIHDFMTCMTGELYALLSEKSVLKPGAPPDDAAAFEEGLNFGAGEGPLASRLFTVRARRVGPDPGERLPAGQAAAFLSGLLIGDEVSRLPQLLGLDRGSTIGLMGERSLCDLYAPALSLRGLTTLEVDAEQAVIAGLASLNGARR
ncbi:MAG TPA: 2-dehydro-3-deoxygalactonokinase [Caulobacteraceae bacterium]|jgi:2-dehydro-3-deoxygalactonokinase